MEKFELSEERLSSLTQSPSNWVEINLHYNESDEASMFTSQEDCSWAEGEWFPVF